MAKYAASWSGGKDSCFALWKARQKGLEVSYLLNITETTSKRSMSHGLNRELIALQATALGIPMLQRKATWETYEAKFKLALGQLKLKGISGLITGDIYLQEHKDWVDRVCAEADIEAVLPLWRMDTSQLLPDFIKAEFKAIIVGVKAEFFDATWLGRQINHELANDLQKLAAKVNIDTCGEHGEFHTFVYDGPLFHRPIHIERTETVARHGYLFLDIKEYTLG
jgi:diphthine-ammonia ligase